MRVSAFAVMIVSCSMALAFLAILVYPAHRKLPQGTTLRLTRDVLLGKQEQRHSDLNSSQTGKALTTAMDEATTASVNDITEAHSTENAESTDVGTGSPWSSTSMAFFETEFRIPRMPVDLNDPFRITSEIYFPEEAVFIKPQIDACKNLPTDSDKMPTIVTMIASTVSHFKERLILRSLFPIPRFGLRLFVVGQPIKGATYSTHCQNRTISDIGCEVDETMLNKISKEADRHGDVVIGEFFDTYQNLTWKTFTMLHWKNKYCPQASVMMKHDEDVFPEFYRLREILRNTTPNDDVKPVIPQRRSAEGGFLAKNSKKIEYWQEKRMWGYVHTRNAVLRSRRYRNSMPEGYFSSDLYPNHPSGPGYIISQPLVQSIVENTNNLPWINIEDAWVGISIHNVGGKFNFPVSPWIEEKLKPKVCKSPAYTLSEDNYATVAAHITDCQMPYVIEEAKKL